MLDKGKDLDWFNSPVIVALTVFAVISFAFFVIWELTEKNPIVDLRLFGKRNFLGGTVAISVAYAVFFSNLVLLPQWMQEYLNYRSVDAGLAIAPLGIFAVMLAPVMAKIMPKSDARVLATLAFVGFAGVFFMRSNYTTGVDTWTLVLPTLLQGIPTALFFVPLTAIILSGLAPDRIPAAAGLSNFVRVFAGAVGTSLASTGWNDRTILHHAQLAEQTSVNNPTYTSALDALQSSLGGSHAAGDGVLRTFDECPGGHAGTERYFLAVGGDLRTDHPADLGDEAGSRQFGCGGGSGWPLRAAQAASGMVTRIYYCPFAAYDRLRFRADDARDRRSRDSITG